MSKPRACKTPSVKGTKGRWEKIGVAVACAPTVRFPVVASFYAIILPRGNV